MIFFIILDFKSYLPSFYFITYEFFFSNKVVFFHIDLDMFFFYLFLRVICRQPVVACFVNNLFRRVLSSTYYGG